MADTEQQPQVCDSPAEPQEEPKPSDSEETPEETSGDKCDQQEEKAEVEEGTCDSKEEMDSKSEAEETNGDEKEAELGDKRRSRSADQSNDNDVIPAKKAKENTEKEDNVTAKKIENASDSTDAKEVATAEA